MNSTSDDLRQIGKEEKSKMFWIALGSSLLATAYSTVFITVGLFALPPFIGWLPFVYGFVNLGITLRNNWNVYHTRRRIIDAMIEMTVKLTEDGVSVGDAINTASDELKRK